MNETRQIAGIEPGLWILILWEFKAKFPKLVYLCGPFYNQCVYELYQTRASKTHLDWISGQKHVKHY